jgi:hypothetical protein
MYIPHCYLFCLQLLSGIYINKSFIRLSFLMTAIKDANIRHITHKEEREESFKNNTLYKKNNC